MNCRACLPNKQAFHCWGSNSNVLWVTCSSSHKHESCTLRFHIRTKTAALTYTHAQPHKKIVPCFPFTLMLLDITLCTVHIVFFWSLGGGFVCKMVYAIKLRFNIQMKSAALTYLHTCPATLENSAKVSVYLYASRHNAVHRVIIFDFRWCFCVIL